MLFEKLGGKECRIVLKDRGYGKGVKNFKICTNQKDLVLKVSTILEKGRNYLQGVLNFNRCIGFFYRET